MRPAYHHQSIPRSRIATFDIFDVGMSKHHVSALLEIDVTQGREKLKVLKSKGNKVSFTAWIIRVIGKTLENHPEAAAYKSSKSKLILFRDINVSILVEKKIGEKRVPLPMVIEKVNEKSIAAITQEIEHAKSREMSEKDFVLEKKTSRSEQLYYVLPGVLRRAFWRFMLRHPKIAFRNMGNVVVTSLGMVGKINGWFIHRSVHPISFGIGSVIKKPVVINNEIRIREILNMTILFDHDVIDGAPFVRFVKDLVGLYETAEEIG